MLYEHFGVLFRGKRASIDRWQIDHLLANVEPGKVRQPLDFDQFERKCEAREHFVDRRGQSKR